MGEYAFSFYSLSQFISALIALAAGIFLYRFRETAGARYLMLMEFSIAIWGFAAGMGVATDVLPEKIVWSKISYFGIVFTPLYYFLFAFSYSQLKYFLKPRRIYLLFILPVITLFMVFTNEYHFLHWKEITYQAGDIFERYKYGPWFWIFYVFTYSLMFSGFFIIYWGVFKFPKYYKPQVIAILAGTVLPMACNWVYVFDVNPIPGYDWTPLSFCFSGILLAFGVIRLRIFKLIPFARNVMVDNMDEGVLVVDSANRIVDNNVAITKLFGTKVYIGCSIHEKFPELTSLLKTGNEDKKHYKEIKLTREGKKLFFDVTISIYNQKSKYFSGILIILHNVTERKIAEKALLKANRDLKEEIKKKENLIDDLDAFSHMVAHDLKNMLGIIVSSSEEINYCQKNNLYQDVFLYNDVIRQAAKKTINITQELLVLASVRQEEVNVSKVNTAKVLEEVIPRLKPMVEESGARIYYPESWPAVFGHFSWLEEVWYNYINNAIKYGGKPPVIKLGCETTEGGNKVRFMIMDNGKGLSDEEMKKLFKPFSRLDGLAVKGNGLGLSIVKRIVEKLGGEVGVESENIEGKGSVFSFTLPVKAKYTRISSN